MTTASANHTRRINALLKKTTFNGCTSGEAASALSLASTIITKHGLNPAEFTWPEPPAGWRWEGVRGHGGTVVEAPAEKPKRTRATKAKTEANPRRERKTKASAAPKATGPTKKEQIIAMLRQPDGTTIDAIVARFGVQRHSARAAISVFGREIGGVTYDRETKVYRATAA